MKIDLYEAKDGWRWRLRAGNGKIVAESGEAYSRRKKAVDALSRLLVWSYQGTLANAIDAVLVRFGR